MKIFHSLLYLPLYVVLGVCLGCLSWWLGLGPGELIAVAFAAICALVIVPCAVAPLFIDLDQYKDPR